MRVSILSVSSMAILAACATVATPPTVGRAPSETVIRKVASDAMPLCICETDTAIDSETGWYRAGCNVWIEKMIKANKCSSNDYVVQNHREGILDIPNGDNSRNLVIGYVGHWPDTYRTKSEIQSRFLPLMKKTGQSIYYDNTACLGTKDSDVIQSFLLKTIKPQMRPGQSFLMKGNQVISIGEWGDYALGPSTNLYSLVGTDRRNAFYPDCEDFLNQYCVGKDTPAATVIGAAQVQEGTTGFCRAPNDLLQLTCRGDHWVGGLTMTQVKAKQATDQKILDDGAKAQEAAAANYAAKGWEEGYASETGPDVIVRITVGTKFLSVVIDYKSNFVFQSFDGQVDKDNRVIAHMGSDSNICTATLTLASDHRSISMAFTPKVACKGHGLPADLLSNQLKVTTMRGN